MRRKIAPANAGLPVKTAVLRLTERAVTTGFGHCRADVGEGDVRHGGQKHRMINAEQVRYWYPNGHFVFKKRSAKLRNV